MPADAEPSAAGILPGTAALRAHMLPSSLRLRSCHHRQDLHPAMSSRCRNAPLVLEPPAEWRCMIWDVIPTTRGTLQLRNRFSRKLLAVTADGSEVAVGQADPPAADDLRACWLVEPHTPVGFCLVSALAGLLLTVRAVDGRYLAVAARRRPGREHLWHAEPAPEMLPY